MMRSFTTTRPQFVRSVRLLALLTTFAALTVTTGAGRLYVDPPSSAFGLASARAERGYFSQMPWERVDPISGNLTLTFTDLVLPGNAGMDVRITRTYSRQADGDRWKFSFVGVPVVAIIPSSGDPALFNADGSSEALHAGVVSGYWITTGFAKWDANSRTLYLPNGWVATYDAPGAFSEYAWLHEVHDQYGNTITPTWASPGRIGSVRQQVDDGAGSHSRTVTFSYDGLSQPASMAYEGRTWSYSYGADGLKGVQPPSGTGPGWDFSYGSGSLTVTTPSGGTVAYSFTEGDRSTLHQIVTGGRAITSGTWTVDYGSPSGTTATTTVTTTPSSRNIVFVHDWSDGPDGKQWVLTDRSLISGSTTVQHVARTYHDTGFISGKPLKAVAQQDITQDGVTYTTTYHYSGSNHDDYLQPDSVTESASNHSDTRVTTNTFHTFSSGFILPKVDSVTVTMGGASYTGSVTYDDNGFVTSQTGQGLTTTMSPDSFGNLASITDPHSHVTATTHEWGSAKTVTTPEFTIDHTINEDGSTHSETQNGATTTFSYDGLGRVTAVDLPIGNDPTTSYASDGSSVTVSGGSSSATTTVDGFGRPTATEDAAGVKTTTTYDADGRKIFQSAPFTGSSGTGNTFEYDALGRVTTVRHTDNSTVTYNYAYGDVAITDENGHTTVQHRKAFGNPSNGRLVSVTDAKNQTWNYSYNVFGSLTSVHPPEGPDRTWSYNATSNLLESETQPESGTTTYTYSGGLLASKTDALSQTTSYQYDANHRPTGIVAPVSTESVTFEYDAAGNRSRMVTGGFETIFTYVTNRLTRREDRLNGHSFVTTYDYDDNDNLTQLTYPSGRGVHYQYDAANEITKVCAGASCSGTIYANNLTYHPTGALASADFGNSDTEALTLDSRFRPHHLTSGPLDVTYSYDPAGNVSAIDDARSGYDSDFSYDQLDRLTGITGYGAGSFAYDAQGNRTSKSLQAGSINYTYNSTTNRLASASGSLGSPDTGTFSYDANGNLTADGNGLTFAYSSSNQMASSTYNNVTAHYAYDADGLRVVKSSPSGVRYYVRGLGSQVLAEYDATTGSPALAREFVYLGNKLLASFDSGVTTPSVTVQVTSPAGGLVTPSDAPVTLTADAGLTGSGSISSVQFYANGLPIGAPDTSAPYATTWSPSSAGAYEVTARAVASTGKVGHAPPVPVTVTAFGRILGVSVSAPTSPIEGQYSTVTVTGNAYSCGAIQINYGDGVVVTYAQDTPFAITHAWATAGSKTVTATGQGNCLGQASTTFTVTTNTPPSVSLTAPANGAIVATGATVTLTASASDAQGVARVDFYDGATLLSSDTTSPWTYTWTSASNGTHTLTAVAVDTFNVSGASASISITVTPVTRILVSPASPTAGSVAYVTVEGMAGCPANVDFGDGNIETFISDAGLPITNPHTWATAGTKTLTAQGLGGACDAMATASTTVLTPPTVAITAPAGGSTYNSSPTITVSGSASAAQGSIVAMTFYANGSVIGTDSTAPYSVDWTSVPDGTYSLTALAWDTAGAIAYSSSVTVIVGDLPASTVLAVLVSPSPATAGQTATITVVGTNPCTLLWMDFGDGNWWINPIEGGLPFTTTHTWASAGSYTVLAKGFMTCGGEVTTGITVNAAAPLPAPEQAAVVPEFARAHTFAMRPFRAISLEADESTPELDIASFDAPLPTTVSVILDLLAGASGTVTSSPSGFNCTGNDTTCSASFTLGATVTLTATPPSGQTFIGWGGACSGTSSTCQISAAEGLLVTAAFSDGASATITYYHTDVLGSVRATTNSSGTTRIDYLSFGEPSASLTGDPKKYLGQDQDAETAFDSFGARYYRNVWGRFTSVDPIVSSVAPTEPQLWNRYAYALNRPLSLIDSTGLEPEDPKGTPGPDIVSDFSGDIDSFNRWAFAQSFSQLFPQGPLADQTVQAPFQIQIPGKAPWFDRLLKHLSNFFGGVGDCLSGTCWGFHGSLSEKIRIRFGSNEVVDQSSRDFMAGTVAGKAVRDTLITSTGLTLGAYVDGKYGLLFGRINSLTGEPAGVFNRWTVRFGWGWDGAWDTGHDVIRLAIGPPRTGFHLNFWEFR